MAHKEPHRSHRTGWLRASVLGANDGIVSTGSLIIGVAAAHSAHNNIVLAGLAGLVAGAMSMAAGEYVSVSSQADTQKADLAQEKKSLRENTEAERLELAKIYENRGLTTDLARQVAEQLMQEDALAAHARDEIGITKNVKARPIQAAFSSAASFTTGALVPVLVALFVPLSNVISVAVLASLVFLAILGAIAARAGGAPVIKAAVRVTFWGALAMAVTAGVGHFFGGVV